MICFSGRRTLVLTSFLVVTVFSQAQNNAEQNSDRTAIEKPAPKPYKILSSGKQITLKSNATIKSVMVWTASGHRIIEQRELDVPSYTFTISVNEKVFFLMLETQDGKRYSEKFGIQ